VVDTEQPLERTRELLGIAGRAGFAVAGVAVREDLAGVPPGADPDRLLPGYRAVIVLGAGAAEVVATGPTGPVMLSEPLAEGLARIRASLEGDGRRVRPLGGSDVSLPRLAAAAGLGRMGPVNALVAAGHGLRLTLFSTATDADLASTKRGASALDAFGRGGQRARSGEDCLECRLCTEDCPALLSGVFELKMCTACGLCVAVCPA
jgi:hypothetical protein